MKIVPAKLRLLALLPLLFSGCGSRVTQNLDTPVSNDDVKSPTASVATEQREITAEQASDVSVQIVSWQDLQDWIADQRGKVVVVDVWSTYCLPCRKEFPHFVALHQRLQEQVTCASLSVDFYGGEGNKPEDLRPQVLEFLRSQKATTANFISKDPDTEVLQQLGVSAVPAVLVYDRQGNLSKVFNNDQNAYGTEGFSYDQHIVPFVQNLTEGSPG